MSQCQQGLYLHAHDAFDMVPGSGLEVKPMAVPDAFAHQEQEGDVLCQEAEHGVRRRMRWP